MNLEIVAALIRMMEQSRLTAMEVEQGGLRVRLENDLKSADFLAPAQAIALPEMPGSTALPSEKDSEEAAEESGPRGSHEINSPMVGAFHEIKGGKVKIGTELKKGEAVCIIEAMKVMNEILMEEDGVITYIAAQEGDMVEFGQMLYMYD